MHFSDKRLRCNFTMAQKSTFDQVVSFMEEAPTRSNIQDFLAHCKKEYVQTQERYNILCKQYDIVLRLRQLEESRIPSFLTGKKQRMERLKSELLEAGYTGETNMPFALLIWLIGSDLRIRKDDLV